MPNSKNKISAINSNKTNISFKRKIIAFYENIILLLKICIFAFILLITFTNIFKTYTDHIFSRFYDVTSKYGLSIHNITTQGNYHISHQEINDIIGANAGDSILAIDIHIIKAKLEDHIWVKNAIVEKRLPDTISIAIIERRPIAIWQFQNKLYLIDSEGNRIAKYSASDVEELLHVVGHDANIYAQSLINKLDIYPNLASKILSAVRYGQRRWNLHLEQKIIVKMPEKDFDIAYKYLNSLNKNKKLFNQNYKLLDLRDINKYYLEYYKK